ncbi:hypothetical protein D3C87_1069790 [compost metagenome]
MSITRRGFLGAALAAVAAPTELLAVTAPAALTPMWAIKTPDEILADMRAMFERISQQESFSQAANVREFTSVEEVEHFFGCNEDLDKQAAFFGYQWDAVGDARPRH